MSSFYFFPVNWGDYNTSVFMYGYKKDCDKLTVLHVKQVPNIFYVLLPLDIDTDTVTTIISILERKVKFVSKRVVKRYRIDGVHINKEGERIMFSYLELKVFTKTSVQYCVDLLSNYGINLGGKRVKFRVNQNWLELWYQFLMYNNLNNACWFYVEGAVEIIGDGKYTIADYEYNITDPNCIREAQELNVPPIVNALVFDIECYSDTSDKFPDARDMSDIIFMISAIYKDKIYILAIDEVTTVTPDVLKNRWDHFDVNYIPCINEYNLIVNFVKLINELKPMVISGYNNMRFDWDYIINRASGHLNCWDCIQKLSFNKFEPACKRELNWSSSAFMNQTFLYPKAQGISHIDLMTIISQKYKLDTYSLDNVSEKFLKKKKDDMGHEKMRSYFLNRAENLDDYYRVAEYCIQDSMLVFSLMKKLKVTEELVALSKTSYCTIEDLVIRGATFKIVSCLVRFCHMNNTMFEDKERGTPQPFRGATVFEPELGLHTMAVSFDFASLYPNIIITYNLDPSTLVSADDKFIKDEDCHVMEWEDHVGCQHDPMIIKQTKAVEIYNRNPISNKKTTAGNITLTGVEEWGKQVENYFNKDMYKNYKPKNKMCVKRYYRWFKNYKGIIPLMLEHLLNERKEVKKLMKEQKKLLEELEAIRDNGDNSKELSKKIADVILYIGALDCMQNACKVLANATYGFTGASSSRISTVEIATCTTYMGRKLIAQASEIIDKLGGRRIYGDTDSNYVKFEWEYVEKYIEENNEAFKKHLEDKIAEKYNLALKIKKENIKPYEPYLIYEKLWFFSKYVSRFVSSHFPARLSLEFEDKIYAFWVIVNKKKYGFLTMREDGSISSNMESKGLILVKRDSCAFTREIYEMVLRMIMDKKLLHEIVDYVIAKFLDLIHFKIDLNKLYFTKSINDWGEGEIEETEGKGRMGKYVVKLKKDAPSSTEKEVHTSFLRSLPAHVQLAIKLNEMGGNIRPGQRLKFLVVKTGCFKTPMYDRIMSLEYVENNRDILRPDFFYYIESTTRAVDSLLKVVFPYSIDKKRLEKFNENSHSKLTGHERPQKILKFLFGSIKIYDKLMFTGPVSIVCEAMLNKIKTQDSLIEMFRPKLKRNYNGNFICKN